MAVLIDRTAVQVGDQRIALRRVIIGRQGQEAVDLGIAALERDVADRPRARAFSQSLWCVSGRSPPSTALISAGLFTSVSRIAIRPFFATA